MPEDDIETQEIRERMEEAREGAEGKALWITWLSLSTAVLAVLAALAALESGSHANEAILRKDDAILHQSKAGDSWAYYQAKGILATLFSTQAELARPPELAAQWRARAEHESEERAQLRQSAEAEEKAVESLNEKAEHSLHVHHRFADSVTIFQVAIALSAIAALTRRKPMWWVSLALGAAGAVFFAMGFAHG